MKQRRQWDTLFLVVNPIVPEQNRTNKKYRNLSHNLIVFYEKFISLDTQKNGFVPSVMMIIVIIIISQIPHATFHFLTAIRIQIDLKQTDERISLPLPHLLSYRFVFMLNFHITLLLDKLVHCNLEKTITNELLH